MNSNKKKILGIGLVVLLIAALTLVYFTFREKPVEGSKAITIEVVNSEGKSTKYELKTDAEYLRRLLPFVGAYFLRSLYAFAISSALIGSG